MLYTRDTIKKVRSGQTVWRCLVRIGRNEQPYVNIWTIHFVGKRYKEELGYKTKELRGNEWYLNDIVTCYTFDTYRRAKQFEKDVVAGYYAEEVAWAQDLADMLSMYGGYDD